MSYILAASLRLQLTLSRLESVGFLGQVPQATLAGVIGTTQSPPEVGGHTILYRARDSSAVYLTGLFETQDDGRAYIIACESRPAEWRVASGLNPRNFPNL